jgi:hypothetical protein
MAFIPLSFFSCSRAYICFGRRNCHLCSFRFYPDRCLSFSSGTFRASWLAVKLLSWILINALSPNGHFSNGRTKRKLQNFRQFQNRVWPFNSGLIAVLVSWLPLLLTPYSRSIHCTYIHLHSQIQVIENSRNPCAQCLHFWVCSMLKPVVFFVNSQNWNLIHNQISVIFRCYYLTDGNWTNFHPLTNG